ncbi:MAG: YqhA family protein [Methanoregula sp.]|nr:YqhA family protein [Methanoregula sp.]
MLSPCGQYHKQQRVTGKADTPKPSAQCGKALADQGIIENIFERALWNVRFIVILGVIFSALSAIVLFIAGSMEIYHILVGFVPGNLHPLTHEQILIGIIGAVDFYLIGLVLLIFSFGIYELFISEIDIARVESGIGNILDIDNLDDLKNKILKVIIMVLIVTFFQRILSMEFTTSLDMLAMAVSICLICVGVYFLGRHGH